MVFITLTVPHPWRGLIPNGRALAGKRSQLRDRWKDRWGECITGVWVVEYQPRLWASPRDRYAPHLHLLVSLPAGVDDDEFGYLQGRRRYRQRLEEELGSHEARKRMRAPRGVFCDWLHTTWAAVVQPGDPRWLIGDVTPVYWSEAAHREASLELVGEYLWRESGKTTQRVAPEGFTNVQSYGIFAGKGRWFSMVEERRQLPYRQWLVAGRVVSRVDGRRYLVARDDVWARRPGGRRGRASGRRLITRWRGGPLTVFVSDADAVAERLQEWSAAVVAERPASAGDLVVESFFG